MRTCDTRQRKRKVNGKKREKIKEGERVRENS